MNNYNIISFRQNLKLYNFLGGYAYSHIKPYIHHIHIKDHMRKNGDYELCFIGDGDIPIKDIVNTLKADGYEGYFSLEWEKKWHPELPDADIAYPTYIEYMKGI